MKKNVWWRLGTIALLVFFVSTCKKEKNESPQCDGDDSTITRVKVFAGGLNNPRGIKFGPDGYLYVAEGGLGGSNSTGKACTQVVPPIGPYTGSDTGARISRISKDGMRTTWVSHLPSSQTSPTQGGSIGGVADVGFIGDTLYALLSGAGCSHGVADIPNGVIKVHADKTWGIVANLSQYQQTHPVAHPDPDDFEPDGTWFSMTKVGGNFYAAEPNHQEIVRISPSTGNVQRLVDISLTHSGVGGHWVGPTSLVYHKGNFYFGTLTPFPIVQGAANIYKVTPGGVLSVYATGFTTVLGILFDNSDRLYVLENTTGKPFPTPGTGKVIRFSPWSGKRETIVSGLNLPTAMTFGPDGKLYISNWGFGPPAKGGGQILQVSFKCEEVEEEEEDK